MENLSLIRFFDVKGYENHAYECLSKIIGRFMFKVLKIKLFNKIWISLLNLSSISNVSFYNMFELNLRLE